LIRINAAAYRIGLAGCMQRLTFFIVVVAAVALAGTATAQSDRTARGRLLVQRYCAGCHSVTRTGSSPNPAAPPFRDLNRRYRIDELGEALAEGILTGHPAMPEFKFPPDDVKAVLAYLKSIQTLQQASGPTRPVE
jgi:cytochrome c